MIGYLLAALVSLLVAGADPTRLREYVAWGFGSFTAVNHEGGEDHGAGRRRRVGAVAAGDEIAQRLLGERYAESMGVAGRRAHRLPILLLTSLLTGVVTAFVGPIGFIGLAAPHLARPLVGTSDHRVLLPAKVR